MKVHIPEPRKFRLKYRTERGAVKEYDISTPIEKGRDYFTAYAFKKGIRSFKMDRLIDIYAIRPEKTA